MGWDGKVTLDHSVGLGRVTRLMDGLNPHDDERFTGLRLERSIVSLV